MSNAEVLTRVGSDGSYDLVVELLSPAPEDIVVVQGDGGAPPGRIEAVTAGVRERYAEACRARDVGLRLCLFQRLPDPFVIHARVRAALAAPT